MFQSHFFRACLKFKKFITNQVGNRKKVDDITDVLNLLIRF